MQAQGHVRVLGGVADGRFQLDVLEALLALAGPGHALERDRLVAEVQPRQLVHAVAVQTAFEDVGDQHHIVDRGDAHAASGHDGEVVFDVLADLQHRRVFQQRLQSGQGRRLVDLLQGRARVAAVAEVQPAVAGRLMLMRQGDVAGLVRPDRQRHAAQPGVGRGQGVGLGVEADHARCLGPRDPAVEVFQRLHAFIAISVDRMGLGRRGDLGLAVARGGDGRARLAGEGRAFLLRRLAVADAAGQRFELHRLQEGRQGFRVRIADQEVVDRFRDRRVAGQLHQLARQADLVGEVDQGLAAFGLFDLAGAR